MADEIVIDWIGGNCPVQAEGTIAGKPFYFRARGSKWRFSVGEAHMVDALVAAEWEYQESYGEGPFDAGWMSEQEARGFIHAAAERYLKEISSGCE